MDEQQNALTQSALPQPEEQTLRPMAGDEMYRRQLEEIQKMDFVLVELQLYLDTHPTDLRALQQFNQFAQRRRQLVYEFETRYGPMLQFGHSFSRFPWQWIETPWPWQV